MELQEQLEQALPVQALLELGLLELREQLEQALLEQALPELGPPELGQALPPQVVSGWVPLPLPHKQLPKSS